VGLYLVRAGAQALLHQGGQSGLGVAMINSEQSLNIARTWGIALVATLLAGIGYAVVAVIGRLVTPWTRAAA